MTRRNYADMLGVKCLIFSLFIFAALRASAIEESDKPQNLLARDVIERCESAKEFITTFEYLRGHGELGLSETEMFKVAKDVAKGCNGAAARFAKSFEVLMKSEAGPRSSMKLAVELANRPQEYCDTFVLVFSRSYLAEYLDLDYKTAYELARLLASEYVGDPRIAAQDFTKLVDFCVNDKEVGLSKPRCGVIVGRVVKKAENFHARIADEFIKLFRFLASEQGAAAPIVAAMAVSEDVMAQGPEAADNFILAFNYGVKEKGLMLTAKNAIEFARGIARNSYINLRPDEFRKSRESRLPASTDGQ